MPLQKGFCPQRDLQNAFELDVAARIMAATLRDAPNQIALILFDVAAAFPDLSRAALFFALAAADLPRGFCDGVAGLYSVTALWVPGSPPRLRCVSRQGVAQGCLLSASLYLLATDVWTRALSSKVASAYLWIFRMCADDIGLLLRRLRGWAGSLRNSTRRRDTSVFGCIGGSAR